MHSVDFGSLSRVYAENVRQSYAQLRCKMQRETLYQTFSMVGVGWLRVAVPVLVQDNGSTYIAGRPVTTAMQIFHKFKSD